MWLHKMVIGSLLPELNVFGQSAYFDETTLGMTHTSTQAAYAANLENQGRGLALYRPFSIRPHSQRVGDIAFFRKDGTYQWVQNAFNKEVCISYYYG